MNTLIRISIAITMLSLACVRPGKGLTSKSTDIYVIVDITDSFQVHPDKDELFNLFDFTADQYKEARFTITTMSDKSFTPRYTGHLAEITQVVIDNQSDPYYRERQIEQLYSAFENGINAALRDTAYYSNMRSLCWEQVCNGLSVLTTSTAREKFLIVYSDLNQYSFFNVYSPEGKIQLRRQQDAVAAQYLSECQPPKYGSGITMMIVYKPVTIEQDEQLRAIVALYRKILTPFNVQVIVETTGSDLFQTLQRSSNEKG